MFTKQLKYDFMFSYKTFFTMFIGIIVLSVIVRIVNIMPDLPPELNNILQIIVIAAGGTAIAVTSYVQILLFYQRSLFSAEGYLSLTLPISRGRLLASKIITTFAWFVFMLLSIPIMLILLSPPTDNLWSAIANVITGDFVAGIFTYVLVPAIALIAILFLSITLANSVIFNKKIHGIVAGLFAVVTHILFFWGLSRITDRFTELETIYGGEGLFNWSVTMYVPQTGLQYGRIPIESGGFVDIFTIAYSLGVAGIAIAATMYLLKKRIALR
ncbi:MAG: hypothetical protein FWD97_06260 [Defluviitaleaceae bacterium]|nr:hypothetical protein [Defluviitaleaceae bacterium]